MAVTFDAKTGMTTGIGVAATVSHTCTGSDRILFVGFTIRSIRSVVSVLYGASNMTLVKSGGTSGVTNYLYVLVNPSSGANNIVITQSASDNYAVTSISYTGAAQTGQPDASGTGGPTTIGAGYSQSITSIADNCMAVMYGDNNSGRALTGGSNTTIQNQPEVAFTGAFLASSTAAKTPAGTFTLSFTSGSGVAATCMASISPAATVNSNFFNFF